jgi:hypothetical protein
VNFSILVLPGMMLPVSAVLGSVREYRRTIEFDVNFLILMLSGMMRFRSVIKSASVFVCLHVDPVPCLACHCCCHTMMRLC